MEHVSVMERVKPLNLHTFYSSKNWSADFACPVCGKEVRQNLNRLGSKHLVCHSGVSKVEARS